MNLFELFVKIGVKDEASANLKSIGQKLGNGLKTAAKVGTAAVGVAAAGITALTTAAVNNYAEYEQLVGGVETLFKDSADKVQEYAANAYKTAGMSANEYMSTVTSFSASLLQSLGGDTDAAAEYANQALTDMSDNANKMGTSMEMIQNAYQGFAKQNYTMLDNLKLGYGGTKTEMERLIADAAKLDSSIQANDLSFGNIVKAINVVQTEMGITGTTALEAGRTISGSVGAMKSAWSNLITGLADGNADIGKLVDNLVTTIVGDGTESNLGVLGNVMPAVKTALTGASKLVSELLPKIVEEIPSIINENLPILAEAAISIIQSLVDGISENQEMLMETAFETITYLANSLITMLPQIVALGLDLIVSLANGIVESLPELIPTIVDVVLQIVNTITDPSTLSNLLNASIAVIIALANGLIESLPRLLEQAPVIVQNLVDAIIENAPKLLESSYEMIVKIVEGIIENLPQILEAGTEIVFSILEGITELLGDLIMKGKDIVDSVKEGFSSKVEEARTWGKDLIDNFIGGITEKWYALKEKVSSVAQTVKDYLGFSEPKKGPLSNFHTYAPDMMDLFIKGIKDNEKKLTDQIEKTFDFGERTITAGISYGSYSSGMKTSNVPYGNNVSVVQNIYSEAKTAADLMQEAIYQQERAVLLGV